MEALLAKTKALYDTPFQAGLINFSCAVDFDFAQYLKSNFGQSARTDSPVAQLLEPIRYRIFANHSSVTVSAEPKLPDLNQLPPAAQLEKLNLSLIQAGLSNWVPYAYGEVLPVGPTKYRFERISTGYKLAMNGQDLMGELILDQDFHLLSGIIDTGQHIELTTRFVSAPNGLVLAASSTDTNHAGIPLHLYLPGC